MKNEGILSRSKRTVKQTSGFSTKKLTDQLNTVMKFKQFMENETEYQKWRRMRSGAEGLGSGTVAAPQSRFAPSPTTTYGAQQNPVVDLLRQGFTDGGVLNPTVVRALSLTPTHNLVAPNAMLGTPQGTYPFVAEKRAGVPTGQIRFVQGFPLEKAVKLIGIR